MTETTTKATAKPSKAAIAKHLIMGVRTLRRLIEEGKLPATGSLDEYREAAFRQLREVAAGRSAKAGGLDLVGERALLAKRQRERVELDLAIKRNRYVEVDEVSRQLTAENAILRDQFYSLGGVCGPYLVNISDARTAQAVVDGKMNEFLQEFQDRLAETIAQFEAAIDAAPEQKEPTK